jgi:endonuclease/exonuclease/phosphatase family metal-dependent hydrolase
MLRSGRVDQPAVLASLTGLRIEFFPTLVLDGQEFGIAVAASGALELHYEPLPHTGEDRPHGVVIASGEGLTMMATHLSRRPRARRGEIAGLINIARMIMGPLLLAGDLNDELSGLNSLESVGFDCRMPRLPTFPTRRPQRQVDHLLPARGVTLGGLHTRSVHASDHLPLIGDATVKGRE